MRSTFWPNRVLERQSSQNRYAGLKFSAKRETVRLPWKLYKTLFSGHAQHFLAKSHFLASKFSKSSPWPEILVKTGKQCTFHENCTKTLFSGHAQHFLAKSKFSKSWNWPQIFFKAEKQCALQENCTKPAFQVMRSRFWPNLIFERQSSQNRETALKFSSRR